MKTRSKIAIAVIATVGIASAALGHNHAKGDAEGPRAERMIERMDTDGDGTVTRADALAFASDRFARMDANGDGQITKDERRAARQARRGERMARMDADGDGMISQAEMTAIAADRAARRFARLDTDGDGLVSVADAAQRGGRHGEDRRRQGERAAGGKRGPATQAMMEARILKRFDRLDTDGDGVVTRQDVR